MFEWTLLFKLDHHVLIPLTANFQQNIWVVSTDICSRGSFVLIKCSSGFNKQKKKTNRPLLWSPHYFFNIRWHIQSSEQGRNCLHLEYSVSRFHRGTWHQGIWPTVWTKQEWKPSHVPVIWDVDGASASGQPADVFHHVWKGKYNTYIRWKMLKIKQRHKNIIDLLFRNRSFWFLQWSESHCCPCASSSF